MLVLLAIENAWFFSKHYLGTATFPYDFSATYHAVPFYWQGAVAAGDVPQWIAHQAYGYPLSLNLQSGLYYPPLWFFPITGLTYSVRAAAIVQCLHILAGGIGAYMLARSRKMSFAAALIAAFAFQAFGGFFCNAQHVDIVRGYALTPWLLWALTYVGEPSRRAFLIPPIVYLMMTGVYPGQAIACLAFGFGYLAVQLLDTRTGHPSLSTLVRGAAWRGIAIVVGVGMSAVSVLPGWLQRDEISRVDEVGTLALTTANVDSIFTTLFRHDYPRLVGDLSMRSLFITVPVLFGVFLLSRRALRQHTSLALVSLVAGLMMAGGTVYAIVTRLVPSLGLSRFPIADYRALVALPLILLGAHGLHSLCEDRGRRTTVGLAIAGFVAFVLVGGYRFRWFSFDARFIAIVVATLALAVISLVWSLRPSLLLAVVIPLCLLDATRIHSAVTDSWQARLEHAPYKRFARELRGAVGKDVGSRPARAVARYQVEHGGPDLDGYLRGQYTADDYAASEHLRPVIAIRSSPDLNGYLMRASAPRLVPLDTTTALAALHATETGSVAAVHYQRERIEYELSSSGDSILLENEPLFRGWTAYVDCDPTLERTPEPALWPLRAWRVPAGTHRLCVRYVTPGLVLAFAISGACLLLWIAGVGWHVWRRARDRSATDERRRLLREPIRQPQALPASQRA